MVKGEGVKFEGVDGEGVKGEGVDGEGVKGEGVDGEGVKGEGVKVEGVDGEGVKDGWAIVLCKGQEENEQVSVHPIEDFLFSRWPVQ
jgi:hypothetical protein